MQETKQNSKKDVLVLFKTHLDIGYTDLAKNVVDRYLNTFIPNAIKVGNELLNTDTPFIWTTGSWIIWEALKHDKDGSVEKAIKDGIIRWHGLPCTTHTELMSKKLFEYGVTISQKLDKRFGKNTIAAKMTDVPGHTKGIIPILKKAGIEFLHLGVNTATPLPPVPPVFKWKCGDDDITVIYQSSYGKPMEFDDFVIYFAHTYDNAGPQSSDEIIEIYNKIKKQYPDCNVRAATLDDVALKLRNLKDLPIIDKEIGDTWIHGTGTDPKKVGMYRELLRVLDNMSDSELENTDLTDNLLMVPEHTWGMCLNKYFHDTTTWYNKDLEKTEGTEQRNIFESSWTEQRDYVTNAAKVMNHTFEYNTEKPDLNEYTITFDANNSDTEAPLYDFEISWQLFDRDDYTRYMKEYLTFDAENVGWAIWDYLKLGMPDYKGGIYVPELIKVYKNNNNPEKILYKFEFTSDIKNEHGLPEFWVTKESIDGTARLSLLMTGKKPSRLPQAFWFKLTGFNEDWQINKLGQWINPSDVIGSPLLSAVESGIKNPDTEIYPLDSALVCPYGRKLLSFNTNDLKQDMYFNLYNNIWNTNFPMWYSDDTLFRFDIKKI